MTRLKTLLLVLISIVMTSCNTYSTFYSRTYTSSTENNYNKIYRLDLSNQNLKVLPVVIDSLPNLKMINLSNNPLLNVDNTIEKLTLHKKLQVLILDSLKINKLTKKIKKLTALKQLSLINNPEMDLTQVIDQISDLPIEHLNLTNNKLSALPINISKINSLKDLTLSHNNINDSLSYKYLGQLPNLYSLWIDHNQLEHLPKTIKYLNQIRCFYLDHNELTDIPVEIREMTKTWIIHAGHNKFTMLPEGFVYMKSLLLLHVNNNQIMSIPKIFESHKSPLGGLILDNNSLPKQEIDFGKDIFSGFFLLSFEQKVF